jgi:hypothetical protein
MGRPVAPARLLAVNPSRLRPTLGERRLIQVHYSPPSSPGRRPYAVEATLQFGAVRNELGERLSRWFELWRELGPALELYFGASYGSSSHPTSEFLGLAQSLEAYDRRRPSQPDLPEQQFEELLVRLRSALPEDLPTAFRDKVLQHLRYLNEPALRQRLKRTLQLAEGTVVDTALGGTKHFVDEVVRNRNLLTHHNKNASDDTGDILFLNRGLFLLLTAVLLRDVGLDSARVASSNRWLARNLRMSTAPAGPPQATRPRGHA